MKRYLGILFAVLLFGILGISLSALGEENNTSSFTSGEYEYQILEDGSACITKFTGEENKVVVPTELDGKKVTSIGANAFSNSKFTTAEIPEGIISIGVGAFSNCKNLTRINIPVTVSVIEANPFRNSSMLVTIEVPSNHPIFEIIDGVLFTKEGKRLLCYPISFTKQEYPVPEGTTVIGENAFWGCSGLTTIHLPDSLTEIEDGAFHNCKSLKNVIIPQSVMKIGNSAFSSCKELTNIEISDNVSVIGDRAFDYCKALTSITIPKGVKEIGENPFVGCNQLTNISVSEENVYFSVEDGVLFDKENKRLICYPVAIAQSSYSIPEGTKTVGASAFLACHALSSVEIPEGVTTIEKNAFSECKGLAGVVIPDSVIEIGDSAFNSCDNLVTVKFSKNLKKIGGYAFTFCKSFTVIVLPDGLEELGDLAFSSCEAMTSIVVPDSVTIMGKTVFKFDKRTTVYANENSYAAQYCMSNGYNCKTDIIEAPTEVPVPEVKPTATPVPVIDYEAGYTTLERTKYESDKFIITFPKTFYKLGDEEYYGMEDKYIDKGRLTIHPNAIELTDGDYYSVMYELSQKANSDTRTVIGYDIDSINGRPVFMYFYKYLEADWVYACAGVYNNGTCLAITYVDISRDVEKTKKALKEILAGVVYKEPSSQLKEPMLFRNIPWGTSLAEVKKILKEYKVTGSSGHGMRTWTVEDYTEGDFAGKYYASNNINIHANGSFSKKVDVAGYEASFDMSFVYLPINGQLTYEESDTALFAARYTINPADVASAEKDLVSKLSSIYGEGTKGKTKRELFDGTTTKTIWDVGGEMKIVLMATKYKTGSIGQDEITISYVWTRGNKLLDQAFEAEQNVAKNSEKKNYNNSNTNGL